MLELDVEGRSAARVERRQLPRGHRMPARLSSRFR
jgi:hypothetical protein